MQNQWIDLNNEDSPVPQMYEHYEVLTASGQVLVAEACETDLDGKLFLPEIRFPTVPDATHYRPLG